MGTTLDDAASVQDDDQICVADGGQAVSDDQARASLEEWRERFLHSEAKSSELVASSRIRMRGSFKIARAIARRCRSPAEKR